MSLCGATTNAPYCANVGSDNANCGACEHACDTKSKCVGGVCSTVCPEGKAQCGGQCVDPRTSWSNCGQCGNGCGSGHQCRDYVCVDTGNVVFVTSTVGDGNRGGLDGADATCQGLAEAAGLGGVFKAWLSDDTGSPATRFTHSNARYALVDGTVIANDWSDLTDGSLLHPLNRNELGAPAPKPCFGNCDTWVHSDTTMDGVRWSPVYSCNNWRSNAKQTAMQIGLGSRSDYGWTDYAWVGGGCDEKLGLYCMQQ